MIRKNTLSFRSAGKVLALFLVVTGFAVCGSGLVLFATGKVGTSRYEKASGRLMRFLSEKDQRSYGALHFVLAVSYLMQAGGLVIGSAGVYSMKHPEKCARFFFR